MDVIAKDGDEEGRRLWGAQKCLTYPVAFARMRCRHENEIAQNHDVITKTEGQPNSAKPSRPTGTPAERSGMLPCPTDQSLILVDMRHLSRALAISVGTALLAMGCTLVSVQPAFEEAHNSTQRAQLQACSRLFVRVDRAISRAGVKDTQAVRITGFPYLRLNRFLASFRDEVTTDAAFDAWLDRLQRLGEQGYNVELRNLPQAQAIDLKHSLPSDIAEDRDLSTILRGCSARLRHHQFAEPATRARLRKVVRAPTEYTNWRRAFGLYPITALPVEKGIARWHRITQDKYARPLDALPIEGELVSYVPPADFTPLTAEAIRAVLRRSARNALGIPEPSVADKERLFATFAPVWQVDVTTNDDRIGAPTWLARGESKPTIDTARPIVYRHISHTRVGTDVLLQLNYIIWFPARPRTSVFDTLGGHLDGITWRVTLSRNGHPLLHDSMHNCGCYHMFFPSPKLRPRKYAKGPEAPMRESVLIPQTAPQSTGSGRLTLRIADRTHYVERVLSPPVQYDRVVTYDWDNYDNLRSLSLVKGGRRSLFRQDGVVPGTKRRERFYLWPMGIPHPGEMRQWGHHATAFVGRRHFDDPYLLEDTFEFNDQD
jgi:hypothetical protein